MLRRRNKHFALLLVLAMLATMFVGAGTASASTNVWCPKVQQVSDDSQTAIGSLFIDVDPGVLSDTDEILEIKLPSDVDLSTGDGDAVVATANKANIPVVVVVPAKVGGDDNAITEVGLVDVDVATNKLTLTVDASAASFVQDSAFIRIYFNKVDIESGCEGDIKATLSSPTNFPTGNVVLANCGGGDATISIDDVNNITESGDEFEDIIIEEPVGGTLDAEDAVIELALPRGFEWQIDSVEGAWGFDKDDVDYDLSDDGDTLKINVLKESNEKGRIIIKGSLKVNESKAEVGDIEVSLSGDVTPDSLVIGAYKEYGAVVEEGTVAEMLAGRPDQKIGEFYIKENAPGSLIAGRSINLTLPEFAKWPTNADGKFDKNLIKVSVTKGSNVLSGCDMSLVDDDAHILKIALDKDSESSSAATIKFKEDTKILLAANASGDLNVEVSGTAGAEGTVKIGTVKAPVTGEVASVNDVKIGVADQPIGDITITEASAKALMEKDYYESSNGKLIVEAPAGVTFATVPTVTVDGTLDIGVVTRNQADDGELNRQIVIPIKGESLKTAGTIKISGIKLTVDRTVPEGPVVLKVKGQAVELTSADDDRTNEEWKNITSVASITAATVVTPAPDEIKGQEAVFTFGSTTYKLNGVDKTASVAPYAENNRTYTSIRDVAYALGIVDSNIMWDQANQTVTLMKGDKVVQLKLGSKVMLINGAAINMDVAVSARDNYTTLPAAWVAQAFGATATWDAATNTVTIK